MAQVQKSAAAVVVQTPTVVAGTSRGQCSNTYYCQEGEYSKLMEILREKLMKTRKETEDWANSRRRVVRESEERLKDMTKVCYAVVLVIRFKYYKAKAVEKGGLALNTKYSRTARRCDDDSFSSISFSCPAGKRRAGKGTTC